MAHAAGIDGHDDKDDAQGLADDRDPSFVGRSPVCLPAPTTGPTGQPLAKLVGAERVGPLLAHRYEKDDGRALTLYSLDRDG